MNKNDNIKIDAISKIDEDIIDTATDSRIALSKKAGTAVIGKRRRFALIASIAASFVLIFSMLLLIIVPMIKQIPVYRGMSVSGEVEPHSETTGGGGALSAPRFGSFEQISLGGASYLTNKVDNAPTETATEAASETASGAELEESDIEEYLKVEGSDTAIYYTTPKQDIYITVHIDNPKQYEILSFTLNGLKYQSYMFELGSTSEELVLKVNVGDAEGVVEYTIDAIKYVDGTEIKDVRMQGEKTVKVGVYSENQPKPTISNQQVDYFSMSFDVAISDPLGLVEKSNGALCAVLSDEYATEITAVQNIDLYSSAFVKFDGLSAGKCYKLSIVAFYDSLDGQGCCLHTIDESIIRTKGYVEILNYQSNNLEHRITFDLAASEDKNVDIEKIEVFSPNGSLCKVYDKDTREISKIFPGKYKICVSYTFDLGDGQGIRQGFAESEYAQLELNYPFYYAAMEEGVITSMFNITSQTYNPSTGDFRTHPGIDIRSTTDNQSVYAIAGGTVTRIFKDKDTDSNSLGNTLVITYGSIEFYYCSLSEISVTLGQTLYGGEVVGTAGAMGYESAALPHVHIEVYVNRELTDPIKIPEQP